MEWKLPIIHEVVIVSEYHAAFAPASSKYLLICTKAQMGPELGVVTEVDDGVIDTCPYTLVDEILCPPAKCFIYAPQGGFGGSANSTQGIPPTYLICLSARFRSSIPRSTRSMPCRKLLLSSLIFAPQAHLNSWWSMSHLTVFSVLWPQPGQGIGIVASSKKLMGASLSLRRARWMW